MSIATTKLGKPEVVKVYSAMAPIYDLWGGLTETHARQKALARAGIQDGEAILDVAVGTGLTFQEILRANPHGENAGIDLTPAMLAKAQTRAAKTGIRNYQLQVGDAYALDFPDHHFNLVMSNYMFDLLPENDFALVLQEFKRVLKPQGRIVLVNMTRGEKFYQRFWESVYRFNPRWLGGCRGVLLASALHQTGFQNIQREFVSQWGFPSEVMTAHM